MATHKRPELPYNSREEIRNLKNVSYQRISDATKIFNAVAHKKRLRILQLLKAKHMLSVAELQVGLCESQAVVSQHLAVMRKAALLITWRVGKYIYYSISTARLKKVYACIDVLLLAESNESDEKKDKEIY